MNTPGSLPRQALVSIAVLVVTVVCGIAAVGWSHRAAPYTATAGLAIEGVLFRESSAVVWAGRENARLTSQAEALVEATGTLLDGVQEIDIDSRPDRLLIHVEAPSPEQAIIVANAVLEVAGADLARVKDDRTHERLGQAEIALGLPSPAAAEFPHRDDAVPAPRPDTDGTLVPALQKARRDAVSQLSPASIQRAVDADAPPSPLVDGLEGALLGGLLGMVLLAGPPHRWKVLTPRPVSASTDPGSGRWGAFAASGVAGAGIGASAVLPSTAAQAAVLGSVVVLAALAARRAPSDLLALGGWLWLLTPLLRRIVEWQHPGSDSRGILIAPVVATLLCVRDLIVRRWPEGGLGRLLGWAAVPSALALGIGLVEQRLVAVAVGAALWLAPLTLAVWGATVAERSALRRTVLAWFGWGAVVTGTYAALQWALAPGWDADWVQRRFDGTFGQPQPFELRAFGTLSAPAVQGGFCAAALIVALGAPVRSRRVVILASASGLMLTLNRTSWLMVAIAVAFLVLSGRLPRPRPVHLASGILLVVALGLLLAPVRARVSETLREGLHDDSLTARAANYEDEIPEAMRDPVGEGFGAVGAGARVGTGTDTANDSTVLDAIRTFGAPGGTLVLGLLVLGLIRSRPPVAASGLAAAGWAVLLGTLVAAPFSDTLSGVSGMVTWSSALLLAGGELAPDASTEAAAADPRGTAA